MNQRSSTRPNPMLVLTVMAAIPAVALFGLWRWADGRVAATDEAAPAPVATTADGSLAPTSTVPAPPALSTGLMSVRRAAAQVSLDLNFNAFAEAMAPFEAAIGDRSCMALSLNGRRVGEANPDLIVIPASNQKILVAAAALDVLGPDFTYTTRVVGPEPVSGVISGDVYLVGGGDPLLSGEWYEEAALDTHPAYNTTPIDELARQMAAAGITQIQGSVLGDGSRYDDEFYAPNWGGGVAGIEGGPYDALLVNDARVRGDDQRGSDPNEAGAREFVRILGEAGITVTGGASTGTAPANAPELATVDSQPLPAVLSEMLTNSDNNTAEMMVKEIGYVASGVGTREAGLDAIASTISSWGIPTDGMVLDDGSGLSLANRVSCTTMLGVLEHVGMTSPVGEGLAVAGETGTLRDVFGDTPVAGRLRAKTGTLNNPPFDEDPPAVKALSGYLPVDGDEIAFTLMLNGYMVSDQSEYRPVWAEMVRAMTSYPAVASPAALGPR